MTTAIFTFITWNVSPVILDLGILQLRWYGILFALGFLLGLIMVRKMFEVEKAPEEWLDKAFVYIVVGGVVGARLGHVFFYQWDYYAQHLAEIPQIWKGGLASHGGAIGVLLALWIYSRRVSKKSMLWILDKVVVPTALAGCFIRLGNLMNSEIVGKPTTAAFGFKFPRHEIKLWSICEDCIAKVGDKCLQVAEEANRQYCVNIDDVPVRHAVQLYESISYLLIFGILFYAYWRTSAKEKPGLLFGLFLVLVWGARFVLEYFKTSQGGFETLFNNALSTGQLLSIPFVLVGLYFVFRPGPVKKV